MDWIESLGYQREVMHTAVLAHLLRGRRATAVAGALLGGRELVEVDDVRTEQRLTGRRPIDLSARIVHPDGAVTRLAVETKVDSAWSPSQLRETVPMDCLGVLLAVGYTALAVTQPDLDALRATAGHWQLVGPQEWHRIVRTNSAGDAELERYASRVRTEAKAHASALEAVVGGRPMHPGTGRDTQNLEQWAFFHEVLRNRGDVALWVRKTLRSGPLLTRPVVQHDAGQEDYLEFVGTGPRRSLCLKTSAPPGTGALNASRQRLRALLADHPTEEPQRPGVDDRTCTAARWWLDGWHPDNASALVDTLLTLLVPRVPPRDPR